MAILRACAPARNPVPPEPAPPAPYKPRYAGKVYPPALADVELLRPVCYPCTLLPEGQPGMVRINADAYLLYPVVSFEGDELIVEGYRFVKSDREVRDVRQERWGLECDCATPPTAGGPTAAASTPAASSGFVSWAT